MSILYSHVLVCICNMEKETKVFLSRKTSRWNGYLITCLFLEISQFDTLNTDNSAKWHFSHDYLLKIIYVGRCVPPNNYKQNALVPWCEYGNMVMVMVFNATFNNISVISWWSALLVEETGMPGENQRPAARHWQTLSQNVVSSAPRLSGNSNSQR